MVVLSRQDDQDAWQDWQNPVADVGVTTEGR